jgi:hypothetical protein
MSPIIGVAALVLAVGCMLLAQRKTISRKDRIAYSLLGGITCIVIAIDAANRSEFNSMLLFLGAGACSFAGIIKDFLKPTKPDA